MSSKKRARSKKPPPGPKAHIGNSLKAPSLASISRASRTARCARPAEDRTAQVYLRAMVRLTEILHRRLPEPPGFDRRQSGRRVAAVAELHGNAA